LASAAKSTVCHAKATARRQRIFVSVWNIRQPPRSLDHDLVLALLTNKKRVTQIIFVNHSEINSARKKLTDGSTR
jgi:hypothetical protein